MPLSNGNGMKLLLGLGLGRYLYFSESKRARDAYDAAEAKLKQTRQQLEDHRKELSQLFDPEHFGSEGEFKKLQDLCLSIDSGE